MICLNLNECSGEEPVYSSAKSLPFSTLDMLAIAVVAKLLSDEELKKACLYYESLGYMPEPLKDWWAQHKNE